MEHGRSSFLDARADQAPTPHGDALPSPSLLDLVPRRKTPSSSGPRRHPLPRPLAELLESRCCLKYPAVLVFLRGQSPSKPVSGQIRRPGDLCPCRSSPASPLPRTSSLTASLRRSSLLSSMGSIPCFPCSEGTRRVDLAWAGLASVCIRSPVGPPHYQAGQGPLGEATPQRPTLFFYWACLSFGPYSVFPCVRILAIIQSLPVLQIGPYTPCI